MFRVVTLFAGLFIGAATALGAAVAQDERQFDLEDFDRIDISAGIILVAEAGAPQTITVKTDNGDFTDFEIGVKNGALFVSRDYNRLRWHSKKSAYKVVVTAPTLRGIEASSGSHAKLTKISSPRFVVDLSSGAHASVEGACEDCIIDLSSGAMLDGKRLECETARIDVSSGGHGKISARKSVVADASSGGHVTVYGEPERVSADKSSGGRIYVASN